MGNLFFWMTKQPPPGFDLVNWRAFLDSLAGASLVIIGLIALLALLIYRRMAMRRRIGRPPDLFGSYAPMLSGLLTIATAVVLAVVFFFLMRGYATPGTPPPIGQMFLASLWCFVLTALIWFLILSLGLFKPAKYKYRPPRIPGM